MLEKSNFVFEIEIPDGIPPLDLTPGQDIWTAYMFGQINARLDSIGAGVADLRDIQAERRDIRERTCARLDAISDKLDQFVDEIGGGS